jgi:hypothetical protein
VSASDQVNAPAAAAEAASGLRQPVIGIECELAVFVNEEKTDPERLWTSPVLLMGPTPVAASGIAATLRGGGVLYFDQGVAEIVTPVIEMGPGATARAVRNLWEQIGEVRDRLTAWSLAERREVRLEGFSTHYNVSFQTPVPPDPKRTVEKLALLLAHVLPLPVALVGGNRRSTGVGVRPRGNRIETTFDFTPDPGLMIATATLVTGLVRGAMALPSYELEVLAGLPLPTVDGVVPGKHSSRRGWLTRDYHFPESPFTANVDARLWPTRDGRRLSLRAIARETAWFFRRSLRAHSDPFSFRLLFAILEGQSPSLLELPDRPGAYEDVGRACRWGEMLPELRAAAGDRHWDVVPEARWSRGSYAAHVASRARARTRARKRAARESHRAGADRLRTTATPPPAPRRPTVRRAAVASRAGQAAPRDDGYRGADRRSDETLGGETDTARDVDRRVRPAILERRISGRRPSATPFPDRHLTRSRYEEVFLQLVAGTRVVIAGKVYRPTTMRGWYHAAFVGEDGEERVLSLDDLLAPDVRWLKSPD